MKNYFISILCGITFAAATSNAFGTLYSIFSEDVEFGITSDHGDQVITSFESGYNGAYYFRLEPFRGVAQTFSVPFDTVLGSAQLRIGDFGVIKCSGQIEIAVYTFDHLSFGQKIASAMVNAAIYDDYDLKAAPISSFGFASGAMLRASQTYALTISSTSSFAGILTVQSQVNNYPNGNTWWFDSPIPEPATLGLLAVGTLALVRKRK